MAKSEADGPPVGVTAIGRRTAPRLRMNLSGPVISVDRVHFCILLNLPQTGAKVAILEAQ